MAKLKLTGLSGVVSNCLMVVNFLVRFSVDTALLGVSKAQTLISEEPGKEMQTFHFSYACHFR